MERAHLKDEKLEAQTRFRTFVDDAPRQDLFKRYGLALALAGLALAIRGALPLPEGTTLYQLPLAAVVLSAWYGGRGPGLLALLICATGIWYWFIPPVHSWRIAPEHAPGFSIFVALCLLLIQFSGGRRRAEHALRASEERFRALVQFSFDVYWETDAKHRFTRQEFSERLIDAPKPGSEIGKTRWEIPYVEPNEAAWRAHRATLDAHLPFRDFELARPTPDGGKRYVSVSGIPVIDEAGQFLGYRGVGRHTTEQRAHVWFLESMERVNRALQGMNDVEQMMGNVLEVVLEIFASDRAWLLYPCDPDAPSWKPIMERTRPGFPGAGASGRDLPMTPESAEMARVALTSSGALLRGGSHERQPSAEIAEHFGVRSDMLVALRPKGDRPYLFGLHQCSRVRTWTKEEQSLFEEIGHRLTDALSSLIALRGLRESESRLEAAQRLANVGWWERDYVTSRVALSDEASRIFGVQPVDLPRWQGKWVSLIHPEDRERVAAASEAALVGGARYDVEYRVVRPDGTVRMVHSQGDVTRDESGHPIRQFGVMQDVTELRHTQRKLEAAQRLAHVGWWERDFAAGRWLTSDEIAQIYGIAGMDRTMDLAEWQKVVPPIIHPEDRQRVLEASEASLRGGPRYDIEYRIVPGDGTVRVVHVQADVTRDEAGRPVRQFGVAQDITELRQAEQELRARQDMLDLAQKAAGAMAYDWYIGARESENRWSPEIEALFGLEPGTFDGTYEGWKKLVHPDDWPTVKLAIKRAHESGDIATEYRVIHKDGTVHWLRGKGRMFFDAEGRSVRNVGFIYDVTDRRQAEQELRASEAALRTRQELLDLAQKAARAVAFDWFIGARENENRWSPELEAMYGLEPGTFDGTYQGWRKLIHPEDWPAVKTALSRAYESGDVAAEYRILYKDGAVHWLRAKGRMFFDAKGQPERMVGFMFDVTDWRLAEEALREKDNALQMTRTELARVSRLTTLGELTTSIVHEVSQPLGAMIASAAAGARWLAAEPPDLSEARSALDNIADDGKRAREVIARIRALAKRQVPRTEKLDINRKILEVLALTERELRSHDIVLRTELDRALPSAAADRIQMQQVLLNLILNAIEAMSSVHDRPRELTIVSRPDGSNAVGVEVRDSGAGLDPGRAEHLFEAFYTTKAEGLGIGLSISRSIVEAHGGRLWAGPNEPHGAIFRFALPIAKDGQS